MRFRLNHDFPLKYKWGSKTHLEYPFSKMLVNESFFASRELAPKVRTAVKAYEKKCPKLKFTVKPVENGIRVWRVL